MFSKVTKIALAMTATMTFAIVVAIFGDGLTQPKAEFLETNWPYILFAHVLVFGYFWIVGYMAFTYQDIEPE